MDQRQKEAFTQQHHQPRSQQMCGQLLRQKQCGKHMRSMYPLEMTEITRGLERTHKLHQAFLRQISFPNIATSTKHYVQLSRDSTMLHNGLRQYVCILDYSFLVYCLPRISFPWGKVQLRQIEVEKKSVSFVWKKKFKMFLHCYRFFIVVKLQHTFLACGL